MDITKNKRGLRHLSLCSGYDGIGLGLELAGFDIGFTVHVEVEAFAASNLVNKIESGALGAGVHYPNLKTFPFSKFRGCFDILSGGFPCQPFSAAGKGKGDEDPRHLFPFIKKGIEECRPAIVVLENVEGIVSAKLKGDHWNDPAGTPVLLHVIRELERVGYRATAVPTSASEVGAPHQRNRWFIVGVLGNSEYDGHASSEDRGSVREESISRGRIEPEQETQESLRQLEGAGHEWGTTCWPSRPGQEQFGWEPPRVVADNNIERDNRRSDRACWRERESCELREDARAGRGTEVERQTQPPLGGNADGSSSGLGYAELCESCDNRTDELRLLGNGVVPQSCADAVLRGLGELLG